MAVRITMEFEATADQYDEVNGKIGEDPPDGLIVHSAVDKGGTMKIVDIWESAEKFGAFGEGTLGPAVAEVMGEGGSPPTPEIEELHNYEVHGAELSADAAELRRGLRPKPGRSGPQARAGAGRCARSRGRSG